MRKITKILVFPAVIVLGFALFNSYIVPSWVQGEAYQIEVSLLKSKFQQAIQEKDLSAAKVQYASLKKILPRDDHFINEIATAYMADLYIAYAHQLAFNQKAAAALLSKAEELAPNHPALKKAESDIAQVQERLVKMDVKTNEIQDNLVKAEEIIALSVKEAQAIKENLLEEQLNQAQDALALATVGTPYPSAEAGTSLASEASPATSPALTLDDMLLTPPETSMEPEAILAQVPMPELHDPCSLAYYTRKAALVSCIDAVDERRYGPALFVVGEAKDPILAFSQQPVSREDYNTFCAATRECYDDVDDLSALSTQFKAAGVELDVRDVEQTVLDYNAYCKMTSSCNPIKNLTEKRVELTKGQLQRYALWLSRVTGYRYRVTSDQDVAHIIHYINNCVQAENCQPALLEQAQRALVYKDKYLTRITERVADNANERIGGLSHHSDLTFTQ